MQRCGANFILILFIYIYTNTLKVYTTTFFWAGLLFHYISRLMMEERRKIKTRQRCYCQAEGLFSQRQVLSYYTRIFKKVYKYNTARKRGSTSLSLSLWLYYSLWSHYMEPLRWSEGDSTSLDCVYGPFPIDDRVCMCIYTFHHWLPAVKLMPSRPSLLCYLLNGFNSVALSL
jgi:hypothetical protein